VYLCVPYGSHNKQRLFPQTALTGSDCSGDVIFPVWYGLNCYILFKRNSIFEGLRKVSRATIQQNMVMSPVGLELKNHYAGEDQQQFSSQISQPLNGS
jgi:hypothetical protein